MHDERELRAEIRLGPKRAAELMERLTTDDEFRARVERQPAETLAEYGINLPREAFEDQASLPSKEEMEKLRGQMEAGELDAVAAFGGLAEKFGPLLWIIRKFGR